MSYENQRELAKSREILVLCTVRLLLLGSPPGDLGPSVPYVTWRIHIWLTIIGCLETQYAVIG